MTSKTGSRIALKARSEYTEAVFDIIDPAKMIEAGSKSPLAVIALVVVILAIIALVFFKAENSRVKLPIFFVLLGAALVVIYKSEPPPGTVPAGPTKFDPKKTYRITPFEKVNKALDVNNSQVNPGQIQIWEWGPHNRNQKWHLLERPEGTYVVQSAWSKLVLDLDIRPGTDPRDNGNRVHQYADGGTPNQRWEIKSLDPEKSGSPFSILNFQSQMALDVAATTDGAEVRQRERDDTASNQKWYIESVPED